MSIGAATAQAGIVFDGSPGTGPPPPTTCGLWTMYPFGLDPSPLNTVVTSVATPAAPTSGVIGFSPGLIHVRVNQGWNNWSNGYTGDVYHGQQTSETITMPTGTMAFYLYAEGDLFSTVNITATTNDGTSSGPISVTTPNGAKYFGFCSTGVSTISTITVSCPTCSPAGFGIGEFGIRRAILLGGPPPTA